QVLKQHRRIQHLPHWVNCNPGQKNRQGFSPPFEPEPLHQHKEAADVIGMGVRKENTINQVVTQPAAFVTAVNGLAAIDQYGVVAKTIEESRMISVRARPSITNPEAC